MNRYATGMCAVALLSGMIFGCSSSQQMARTTVTKPQAVTSVVFVEEDVRPSLAYGAPSSDKAVNRFSDDFSSYSLQAEGRSRSRRLLDKTLKTLASDVRKLGTPTLDALMDDYERDIDKIENKYRSIENRARSLGLGKENFRIGAGATATAAMGAVGGLHLLMPRVELENILGTGVAAGYDLRRVDDPRVRMRYLDAIEISLSKDGVAGALRSDSATYGMELDISDQSLAANYEMNSGVSLGSEYSHKREQVTGFVSFGF